MQILGIEWSPEKRKVTELKNWDKNPRSITEGENERLKQKIIKRGFHDVVKIDTDNTILSGNQRKNLLLQLGIMEVWCLIPERPLTENERAAVALDSNRHEGEFMDELLAGFGRDVLQESGWQNLELDKIFRSQMTEGEKEGTGGGDINVPTRAILGDVWLLGKHRLMCGDSTKSSDVARLFSTQKPILMITDPPYGVKYNPEWREDADLGERSTGKVLNDDQIDWSEAYNLFTGDVAYVWHAGVFTDVVAYNLRACGFEIITQIIWNKQHFVLSRGDYHWKHEPCWYAVKKSAKHNWQGARDQATVWEIKNNNSFGNLEKEETWGHGTQKPLECMLRPILNNSAFGDWVYDPFGGSGTTLMAAEQSGRNCLMMELDPKYCDIIIARWEKLTGQKAIKQNG